MKLSFFIKFISISEIEVDQDDLKVETIDDKFSSLPPCNRTASVVNEVYNLEDIIPAEKLILMCENCESLLQNEENRYLGTIFYLVHIFLIGTFKMKNFIL